MFVDDLKLSWWQHDFLRPRFKLEDPQDLSKILAAGSNSIVIDTEKGLDVAAEREEPVVVVPASSQVNPEPISDAPKTSSYAQERVVAKRLHARARKVIREAMAEARSGRISGYGEIEALAGDMTSSVMRNPGALVSLAGLKDKDDYTFMHCVSVGTFMIALGRCLGLDADAMRAAGAAGLMHDVGKACIPDEILNKPGKLTDVEFKIIRGHPELGHRMLLEAGHPDNAALDVVIHHHERLDGAGYPHRLKGEQVSLLARMGAVADVYDAVTSDRCYHKAMSPSAALKMLMASAGTHFDKTVVQAFVRTVGIYPTGSLVRLASNRLAVVTEQNAVNMLSPKVRIFYSIKSNGHVPIEDVDLTQSGDAVVNGEDPATWGLDLSRYGIGD